MSPSADGTAADTGHASPPVAAEPEGQEREALSPSRETKLSLATATVAPRSIKSGASQVPSTGEFTITVSKGKELFTPWSFNSFEVGPLSLARTFPAGVTPFDAYSQVANALEELFEVEYQIKLAAFREHALETSKTRPLQTRAG